MATRRYDPEATATAVRAQAEALGRWLAGLPDDAWTAATDLDGWTVAHVVNHLAQTLRTIATVEPTTARPDSIAAYLARLPAAAEAIRDREVAAVAGRSPADLRDEYEEQRHAAGQRNPLPPTVQAPRGPLRAGDFLATRAMELAVHSDDLARARPDQTSPPLDRPALRIAVRLLADVLATNAPGHAVEVRIPPYAAVQCLEGPRHTRGTPPTVIETDPVTWLRLATGRTSWAEAIATHRVTASGERSDLSAQLPVLR